MKKKAVLVLFFLTVFETICFSLFPNEKFFDPIVLQLKWKHSFQFAGYYMALEKGFYRDAGLNVVLKEGGLSLDEVEEVVHSKAQYGVSDSSLVVNRVKGEPVVVLSAIFQHSPAALFVKKDIENPQDLHGKRLVLGDSFSEITAMIQEEGVDLSHLRRVSVSRRVEAFLAGEVDGIVGYLTDLPYRLQKQSGGRDFFRVLSPIDYGIDFYGDCLFTTESEIQHHPARVSAFVEASIKGWEYAMSHPKEAIDLILRKYNPNLSQEALLFEANAMKDLMLSDYVDIGHINLYRWQRIAALYASLRVISSPYSLKGFVYDSEKLNTAQLKKILLFVFFILMMILFIVAFLLFYNRRLNSEVKKRTEELRDLIFFSNALLDSLPGIFCLYELEGNKTNLVRWNKNFELLAEMSESELKTRSFLDWFQSQQRKKIEDLLKDLSEEVRGVETVFCFNDSKKLSFYLNLKKFSLREKMFVMGIGLDLSEKKRLEEQLRQSQKMEAIGRLTGGVAHDFNNLLTVILGYSELLLKELPEKSHRELVGLIYNAGKKAEMLTRQLLAFGRKQIIEKKILNVNEVILDLLKLLEKILGEKIRIETNLKAENGIVEADPGQLEQILMNLVVNARDAMPFGGKLRITTKDVVMRQKKEQGFSMKPGNYVMIAVEDSGEGMSPEIMDRIFEPFFTTKKRDKGSGLGLSTVYGIVQQHGGDIEVRSKPDHGTLFRIYLPRSEKSGENRQQEKVMFMKGNEKILVLDDEDSVRRLVTDTLSSLGYLCLEASCGKDALELSRKHDKIDLLLSDVIMPEMNGRELAEKLLKKYPEMKVIFMSGYAEDLISAGDLEKNGMNYISKPLTPTKLAKKVREVLDKRKTT